MEKPYEELWGDDLDDCGDKASIHIRGRRIFGIGRQGFRRPLHESPEAVESRLGESGRPNRFAADVSNLVSTH